MTKMATIAGSAAWLMACAVGPMIMLAPDAGAGAGAGDGGAPPAGDGAPPAAGAPKSLAEAAAAVGGADPQGGQPAGGGAPPSPGGYRPDGLPDHLYGASERDTIDKLFKAFDGYRRGEAERGSVPKEPKDYAFEPDEAVKPYLQDLAQDEFWGGVLEDAHKAGITDKQLNAFINPIMKRLVESGSVEAPIDFGAELDRLIPIEAKGLDAPGQKAAAARRIQNNLAFIDGLKDQGLMDEDLATYMQAQLGDTAMGHKLIEFIAKQSRQLQPALGGEGFAGKTEADFDKHLNDPRNDPSHPEYRQWQKERTAMAKAIWGAGARA